MPPAQLLKATGDSLKKAAEPVLERPQFAPEKLGEVRAKNELQKRWPVAPVECLPSLWTTMPCITLGR